jgi:RNase P subunit RPR2
MSFYDIVNVLYIYIMNEKQKTITIICDNEDCRTEYKLSLDTLKAADYVEVTCKKCGEIQQIMLNKTGGIEIFHVK